MEKEELRVNYFIGTVCLLNLFKKESSYLIKRYGVKIKSFVPNLHKENTENIKFTELSVAIIIKEEKLEIFSSDIIEDSIRNVANNMNALTSYE